MQELLYKGASLFATQIISVEGMSLYQIPRYCLLGFPLLKNPNSNLPVAEISVWLMEREFDGVRMSVGEAKTGEK